MPNERFMRHHYGPSGYVDPAKQPPCIGDFVQSRIGQTWTVADAEEVLRQWRRMDELAQELIRRAREDR